MWQPEAFPSHNWIPFVSEWVFYQQLLMLSATGRGPSKWRVAAAGQRSSPEACMWKWDQTVVGAIKVVKNPRKWFYKWMKELFCCLMCQSAFIPARCNWLHVDQAIEYTQNAENHGCKVKSAQEFNVHLTVKSGFYKDTGGFCSALQLDLSGLEILLLYFFI